MSHFNRIGDRRVRKEATKRSQITPLESLHIELKIPVSGAVRDHLGESVSIRIGQWCLTYTSIDNLQDYFLSAYRPSVSLISGLVLAYLRQSHYGNAFFRNVLYAD